MHPIFRELFTGPWAEEFDSVSQERDPVFRAESLLIFGDRLSQAGEDVLAARVYGSLGEDGAVASRAAERLAALQGRGSFGATAESLLRRSARQALDPALLLGMSAASSAFRLTRLATATRFALAESNAVRIIGETVAAPGIALGAEALVFPLVHRTTARLLGHPGGANFSEELASSFLMLGALRASGALARPLAARRPWVSGIASLGGIFAAQSAEAHFGLRAPASGANRLADALCVLLQSRVAARFAGEYFPSFLTAPTETWESIRRQPLLPEQAWAMASGPRASTEISAPRNLAPTLMMMENNGDGTARGTRITLHGPAKSRETSGVVQRSPDYNGVLLELLEHPERNPTRGLQGPLAEMLRHQAELREALLDRLTSPQHPAFIEIFNARGDISKILFFHGAPAALEPDRILFTHEVLRYTESFDTLLFEFNWKTGGEILGRYYYPGLEGPPRADTHHSDRAVIPQIVGSQHLRWVFFPKTSQQLHLERLPDQSWEIRDAQSHLVLKLPQRHP